MRLIDTKNAVGHVLCHDITVIIRDVKKGVAFKKGHIVTEADIPELLKLGKDHLYVYENDGTLYHEDEAAAILRDICMGENMRATQPSEGKIELIATCDGLFTVDSARLHAINAIDELMIATRHGSTPVKAGDRLAGTRVIPLLIKKEKLAAAKAAAGDAPLLRVLPYRPLTCGIVTTGNEVYHGRITDTFTPVVESRLAEYGMRVIGKAVCPDDRDMIVSAIHAMRDAGAQLILTTGGMSVDPDDRTPGAIRAAGTRVIAYGAPVLPGAMMLVGYLPDGRGGEIPVMGLPGCVMYARRTVFDLLLPRVAAGVTIRREDIVRLGEGGLCLSCEVCTYPNCGFGK